MGREPYRDLIVCGTVIPHADVSFHPARVAAAAAGSERLLLTLPTRSLMVGVVLAALVALPVPASCSPDALHSSGVGAGIAAVRVAAVARPTDGELLPAATARLEQEHDRLPGRGVPTAVLDAVPVLGVLPVLDGLIGQVEGRPRGLGAATPGPHSLGRRGYLIAPDDLSGHQLIRSAGPETRGLG